MHQGDVFAPSPRRPQVPNIGRNRDERYCPVVTLIDKNINTGCRLASSHIDKEERALCFFIISSTTVKFGTQRRLDKSVIHYLPEGEEDITRQYIFVRNTSSAIGFSTIVAGQYDDLPH